MLACSAAKLNARQRNALEVRLAFSSQRWASRDTCGGQYGFFLLGCDKTRWPEKKASLLVKTVPKGHPPPDQAKTGQEQEQELWLSGASDGS